MTNMNKQETATEIDTTINDLIDAERALHDKIRNSDHVFAAKIDQCTKAISDVVERLEDMRDEVMGGVYAEVRAAMDADHQYVYDSILYWMNNGEDMADIAAHLETSIEALVDVLDEFFMDAEDDTYLESVVTAIDRHLSPNEARQ